MSWYVRRTNGRRSNLLKSCPNKRRFQKRKTIKEILGFNTNMVKTSKRAKTDGKSSKVDMSLVDNLKTGKSPQNKSYKNAGCLDQSAVTEPSASLLSALPNLPLNDSHLLKLIQDRGDRSLSSSKHMTGLTRGPHTNDDYCHTDKENKHSESQFDHTENFEHKNMHTFKKKILS